MKRGALLAALRTIREECRKHNPEGKYTDCGTCQDCPLSRPDRKCAVTWDVPETWKLEDDPDTVWRAMR